MTTSWKVTGPLVAGTETVTLGDGVVTEGLVGESATGGVGIPVGVGGWRGVGAGLGWDVPVKTEEKGMFYMAAIFAEAGGNGYRPLLPKSDDFAHNFIAATCLQR